MKKIIIVLSAIYCINNTGIAANSINKTIPNKNQAGISTINDKELCASILIGESGIDGINGMKGVLEVIRTRMKQTNQSMLKIITEKHAFSCYTSYRKFPQRFIDKHKKNPLFNQALFLVNNYREFTLTKGSNYFHEQKLSPHWAKNKPVRATIGHHKFYLLPYKNVK